MCPPSPPAPSSRSMTSVIDSVVHASQSVLSFRTLSELQSLSLREAQQHLSTYVSNSDVTKFSVLYHVRQSNSRVILTTNPSSSTNAHVHVWAIGPKSMSKSSASIWLMADRESALAATSQPSEKPNPLRDGRFHPIVSTTAAWDTRPDPRFRSSSTHANVGNNNKPATLLAAVKQSQKRRAFKSSSSINNSKSNNQHHQNNIENKHDNKSFQKHQNSVTSSHMNATPSSLFTSKKLGQDAANRIRAKQNSQNVKNNINRKNLKKRRANAIQDEEDEDEDHNNKEDGKENKNANELDDGDDNDDDDVDSEAEMERRAMEREQNEDDRAEVERELHELTRQDTVDEPESPVMKDVDEEAVVKQEVGEGEQHEENGTKRSFRETFGLPSEEPRGSRRIKKQVDVTVEEDGYLVTRRVTKVFDENGNEIIENPTQTQQKDNEEDDENEHKQPQSLQQQCNLLNGSANKNSQSPSCLPSGSSNGSSKHTTKRGGMSQQKEKNLKSNGNTKTKGLAKNGGKKSKKVKGNIMSYFGKKT